jgi:predicted sugar kinase
MSSLWIHISVDPDNTLGRVDGGVGAIGRTPLAEIEWMKATYALPAHSTPSIYVSSH